MSWIQFEPTYTEIYIPGFYVRQLSDTSFWFARENGEGMEVSIETMEKIFKEFM